MVASANYFEVLGVRPFLGRGFLPAEDEKPGGAPVAVISYRLWQSHFGANPNIVGQPIQINQHPYTIVGVTPAVFQGKTTTRPKPDRLCRFSSWACWWRQSWRWVAGLPR